MERSAHGVSETSDDGELRDGWAAWEAVPRDGPAVFVIDSQALDKEQRLHGRWIDPTQAPEAIGAQLSELLGRPPDDGSWAVIDQVGLGPLMLPESLNPADLPQAALEATAEASP